VRTHLFFKEEEWDTFKQIFETYLFEAAKVCLFHKHSPKEFDSYISFSILFDAVDNLVWAGADAFPYRFLLSNKRIS